VAETADDFPLRVAQFPGFRIAAVPKFAQINRRAWRAIALTFPPL
jgi:hypothetical protein